jgi:hypothetical protein
VAGCCIAICQSRQVILVTCGSEPGRRRGRPGSRVHFPNCAVSPSPFLGAQRSRRFGAGGRTHCLPQLANVSRTVNICRITDGSWPGAAPYAPRKRSTGAKSERQRRGSLVDPQLTLVDVRLVEAIMTTRSLLPRPDDCCRSMRQGRTYLNPSTNIDAHRVVGRTRPNTHWFSAPTRRASSRP